MGELSTRILAISARGSATAALGYYAHLSADSYYTRDGEPPGRWAGAAAERLGLDGPVTRTEFDAALRGYDPKIGAALTEPPGNDLLSGPDAVLHAEPKRQL